MIPQSPGTLTCAAKTNGIGIEFLTELYHYGGSCVHEPSLPADSSEIEDVVRFKALRLCRGSLPGTHYEGH